MHLEQILFHATHHSYNIIQQPLVVVLLHSNQSRLKDHEKQTMNVVCLHVLLVLYLFTKVYWTKAARLHWLDGQVENTFL